MKEQYWFKFVPWLKSVFALNGGPWQLTFHRASNFLNFVARRVSNGFFIVPSILVGKFLQAPPALAFLVTKFMYLLNKFSHAPPALLYSVTLILYSLTKFFPRASGARISSHSGFVFIYVVTIKCKKNRWWSRWCTQKFSCILLMVWWNEIEAGRIFCDIWVV